jgi:hypothetical protein
LSIESSDLLIHQYLPDVTESQNMLFDPKTGKDISKPFTSRPATWRFNRSRTACLTLEGNEAVIFDTLSAQTGQPTVLARPPWAKTLHRLQDGFFQHAAILTEDARHLILFPYVASSSSAVASNFTCEVWSTNTMEQNWSIPIELKEGKFVDAELINGEVLLLMRGKIRNGVEQSVELLGPSGKTLHAGTISASTLEHMWNIKRQEVLFRYYDNSPADNELPRQFYLWNYLSNTVQHVTLKR